jgi:hypothetical protein
MLPPKSVGNRIERDILLPDEIPNLSEMLSSLPVPENKSEFVMNTLTK